MEINISIFQAKTTPTTGLQAHFNTNNTSNAPSQQQFKPNLRTSTPIIVLSEEESL